MKVFSASLCFRLLALLSVMILLKSAHGRQPLTAGHELFPANEYTIQEKLLLALLSHHPSFQRPSHAGVDLPIRPEDLKQLKKLKRQFMQGKSAEHAADAVDSNLSPSRANKRDQMKIQNFNSQDVIL
ncbi:urotensin-2B [Chionomys nivalis]|uniref:urotensin-2B n=1 Tax=Chionomys nivalis TaxID=269649 RepID=UPI002594936F|nr:urotensin-2B [Chionomys nivalis]